MQPIEEAQLRYQESLENYYFDLEDMNRWGLIDNSFSLQIDNFIQELRVLIAEEHYSRSVCEPAAICACV